MAVYVKMPKFGLTMETGLITEWLKKEGDSIEKGEVIAVIETDKIANEFESPEAGHLLKILVKEDEEGKILEPICIIGKEDEIISGSESIEEQPSETKPDNVQESEEGPKPVEGHRVNASPIAVKMARKHQIDLSKVKGSGINGRIMQEDVQQIIANGGIAVGESTSNPDILGLSKMRQIIATKMSKSKAEIPHVYINTKVDASNMIEFRNTKEELVSYNAMIIKTIAQALSEFPVINASFTSAGILLHKDINIGFAVALDDGLIVPVVKNVGNKTREEIEIDLKSLVSKARSNELSQDEISHGTFTVSNLGMYDIDEFYAIINPPESAIVAIGKIQDTVAVEEGNIVVKPQFSLNLSVDHRSIDGAVAAQFLQRVKAYLQQV